MSKGLQKEMTKTAERRACREEGMQRVGVTEGDARVKVKWRRMICCGDLRC